MYLYLAKKCLMARRQIYTFIYHRTQSPILDNVNPSSSQAKVGVVLKLSRAGCAKRSFADGVKDSKG